MITLLKVTDAPIQVPNIFYLTVSFKFLDFSFQICLLLFLKCLLASRLILFRFHYSGITTLEGTLSNVCFLPHKMLFFHKFITLISRNFQVFRKSCAKFRCPPPPLKKFASCDLQMGFNSAFKGLIALHLPR
jgi:hypothetical protein